ncbi:MAG: aldehyde dehydrogenase family protein, partial [Cytophagales bacterium]|nr:aldehyde dehydrogenase family protein [Rhizobacter sp.]
MNDTATPPTFASVDPATLLPGNTYPGHSARQAADKIARAAEVQRLWRRTGFDERARLMQAAAGVLRARRDEFAALMT